FLQMSDPSRVYEVTLFSELLHSSREILEPGQALLLSVDAEMREDQMRLTATRIEKLDEALEHKINRIEIHLSDSTPVAKLNELLSKGQSEIGLFVELEDGRVVEMSIPGRWGLDVQARNILRSEPGISGILEI